MIRLSCFLPATAFLFAASALPLAAAPADTPEVVLRDCGSPDLPDEAVESCLERAQALDQTEPSKQLEALEAQLELRAGRDGASEDAAPQDGQGPPGGSYGPPDDQGQPDGGYAPDDQNPPDGSYGPPDDQGQPDGGYAPDDQTGPPQDEDGPPPPSQDDTGPD